MAAPDRPASSSSSGPGFDTRWGTVDRDDAVLLVAGVALLAVVVRLVLLGDRIAHWDEARVGYWIVHYQETGAFTYRRIIHGPFVQHVNRWLFALVGANDFTMRLPVALVGGLLPLSALLFREHLRRVEMVAMALFLSFNPVLLYYARFMRSDVLVAGFMFVAFGLFVRFYDTRKLRYVLVASALVACGFASKENAAVYVLTWVGALGLLVDVALFRPRAYRSGYALVVDRTRDVYRNRVAGWLSAVGVLADAALGSGPETPPPEETEESRRDRTNGGRVDAGPARTGARSREEVVDALRTAVAPFRYAVYLGAVALVFLGLMLFFYAPRAGGVEIMNERLANRYGYRSPAAVGFWQAIADPAQFFQMVEWTWNYFEMEFGAWFGQAGDAGDRTIFAKYAEFLGRYVEVMGTKATPLTAFAVFGFLLERYGSETTRNVVLFAAYGGFVSVLGYPLGTDIFGAWIVVHALVPLSIPAAVGLARVYDWGYEAFTADDAVGVGIAAVLLLLVAGSVAGVAATSVYENDQSDENTLVQYAQPAGDPRPELEAMAAIGRENRTGSDVVLYYGEQGGSYDGNLAFVKQDRNDWETSTLPYRPACAKWFNSLPLPWYFAKDDVDVSCSRQSSNLTERVGTNPPPMVVTQDRDGTVPRDALRGSYVGNTYELRVYGTETTFWVRNDVARERGITPSGDETAG